MKYEGSDKTYNRRNAMEATRLLRLAGRIFVFTAGAIWGSLINVYIRYIFE